MGKAIKLHPVVVLLSVTAAGLLLGLPGAFLAVPTVASAANVIGYFRQERGDGDPPHHGPDGSGRSDGPDRPPRGGHGRTADEADEDQ